MAKVLILGGGFGGVVAAERLAKELGDEHQITLVSRSREFVFHPALVRLAFGKCERDDVAFDLRRSMLDRRVNFIEAEVARVDPQARRVTIAHGEVEGNLPYDYLIFALGRRLATERVTGFYEHAHHLLTVDKALKFRNAIARFQEGRVVIGQCAGARLPVPVYETAFAFSRMLEERGDRSRTHITVVSPDPPGPLIGDSGISSVLRNALGAHDIEFRADFPIDRVTPGAATTSNGHGINFDLMMLLPPFHGSAAASYLGITNPEGYINVETTMRVSGLERMYAIGDCVNFSGQKMGHMAVRQGEIAALNLVAEINGQAPEANYMHEARFVIDEGGSDSIFIHQDIWMNEPGTVRQGRFWSWAKQAQQKYWETVHS